MKILYILILAITILSAIAMMRIARNFQFTGESGLDSTSRTLNVGLFKELMLAKFSIALGAYLISSLILFYKSINLFQHE